MEANKGVPIRQSLTKPIMIAGAERELMILVGFSSAMILTAGMSFLATTIAAIVFFVGTYLARALAKEDPYIIKIFLRHIKYRNYYPATEKLEVPEKEIKLLKD